MIPYKDDNPAETFPYVTIGLIALNVLAFLWEVFSPGGIMGAVMMYGVIPGNLFSSHAMQEVPAQGLPPGITVLSSMFLHGGLFHLVGNMLYLWIFGNNIEDRLGHIRFIFFYFLCGIIAVYSHALTATGSATPMVGASGAISGVLGAYLVLFPRAGVYTVLFFGFFIQVMKVPALIVIGFWAIIQFVNGLVSKGIVSGGGVAWFAHIGGFVAGVVLIKLLIPRRRHGRW